MSARPLWSERLSTSNMVLTAVTALVVLISVGPHLRGGAENLWTDRVQAYVLWAYFVVTPLLGLLAWFTRDPAAAPRALRQWPIALWLLVVVGATFVHF